MNQTHATPARRFIAPRRLLCAALLALAAPWCASANPTAPASTSTNALADPQAAAREVAAIWMKEIDGDQYGKSWDQAASLFQSEVTREKWETNMIRVRGLLGSAEKRKLVSSRYQHSLPGMPDGDYVVITWATQFEHKARALEIITPMKDKDGRWKVAGYVIR